METELIKKKGFQKKEPVKEEVVVETIQEQEFGVQIDPEKTYKFQLIGDISKGTYVGINNVCEVFDPSIGRRRKMRYIPHYDSIWIDEQPEEHIDLSNYPINFFMSEMTVSGKDKNLILYLLNHDRIEGKQNQISSKGPLFRLQDNELIAKKALAKTELERDAINKALSLSGSELGMVTFVLFGKTFESETEALQAVANYAKKNPKGLIDICDDPRTRRKYLIKQGLDKNVIKSKFSMLKWGASETDIVQLPPDKDMLSFITDWSLSDDGKDFIEVLKRQMNK